MDLIKKKETREGEPPILGRTRTTVNNPPFSNEARISSFRLGRPDDGDEEKFDDDNDDDSDKDVYDKDNDDDSIWLPIADVPWIISQFHIRMEQKSLKMKEKKSLLRERR